MTGRLVSWILVFVVAAAALVFGTIDGGTPRTDADRAYSLAKDFACPQCQGQSVAESDVVVARTIRQQIATWVDEGRSDGFIRDQLVAAFGEDIDYTPSASGITSLVWILPVVGGVGAVAGLWVVFRRWKREIGPGASPADERLVAEARERMHDTDG